MKKLTLDNFIITLNRHISNEPINHDYLKKAKLELKAANDLIVEIEKNA